MSVKKEYTIFQSRNGKKQIYDGENFHESIIIHNDKIFNIGNSTEMLELMKKKEDKTTLIILDDEEEILMSGFIDSHVHCVFGGLLLGAVNLREAKSKVEMMGKIRERYEFMKEKGGMKNEDWIIGYEYNDCGWKEAPNKEWLDEISKEIPMALFRFDLHSCFVNSKLMAMCEIDKTTKIEGGEIILDEKGELTGILKDLAMFKVMNILPMEKMEKGFLKAQKLFLEYGITSVTNMGNPFNNAMNWREYRLLKDLEKKGKLKVRIHHAISIHEHEKLLEEIEKNGRGTNRLKIGLLKGFMDGSLGSRTALQFRPYRGEKDYCGLQVISDEKLYDICKDADQKELQICVHAIGEKANFKLLENFRKVIKENGERDRRFRVEHSQQIRKKDIDLYNDVSIFPVFNPAHIYLDDIHSKEFFDDDGESFSNLHREKDFFEQKERIKAIAFGSDFPVVDPNIFRAIYNVVKYRGVSVKESVDAFTKHGAFLNFQDSCLGSLKKGHYADFVVLSKNIFQMDKDPEQLNEVKIKLVFVNGEKVYQTKS